MFTGIKLLNRCMIGACRRVTFVAKQRCRSPYKRGIPTDKVVDAGVLLASE